MGACLDGWGFEMKEPEFNFRHFKVTKLLPKETWSQNRDEHKSILYAL